VVHRALTAVQVTTESGTIHHPKQHTKIPARPMNKFVGKAGRRASR
jgi:hypothetical protein